MSLFFQSPHAESRSSAAPSWILPVLAPFLAWLAFAATHMTSITGSRWAASTFGLRIDADDAGSNILLALLSLAALAGCAWALGRLRREGRGATALALLGGLALYVLGMGLDPSFPFFRFLLGLFTTLEVPLRMALYLLPGLALGILLRFTRSGPAARLVLAFMAGLTSHWIVRATQDGWGLLNLADWDVPIYATAAALGSYGLGLWDFSFSSAPGDSNPQGRQP